MRKEYRGGSSMLRREESRHDFAFIAGVIVGALAGAAATLALTPMSGAETRGMLMARTSDLGPVKDKVVGMASNVPQMVAPVKDRAVQMAGSVPSKVEPVKERAVGFAHAVPQVAQVVAPMKDKVTAMAAKAPIPGRHQEGEGQHSAQAEEQVTSGFGPHGAHSQEPVEGSPEPAKSGGVQLDTSQVAFTGAENPLEDTPAQSVMPDVDGDGKLHERS